jgi:CheY-like chemotaxis protein
VKRILIVDDDPNLGKLFDFALQKAGFEVLIARDGNQGLAMAMEHRPDAAVLDVMMPGFHGYELCRRLRADPGTAHIKIIFLTARTQPIDRQEAMRAGADLFLSKPVLPADLVQEIRTLLGIEGESAPESPEMESEPELKDVPEPERQERPAAARPAAVRPSRAKGHLLVCYSPSSRVGVTTLSVNLALAFALSRRAETPLIELHPTPSDVLSTLGLGTESLRGNLKATGNELSWDTLLLHLVDHPSKVRVLPAPPLGSDVPPLLTRQAISLLLFRYPLVLADAASELDARVQSALLAADLIFLVTTPQTAALRSALQSLQELRALEYPERQILLVVNQIQPQAEIPVEQIAKGIRHSVFAVIPHEPAMSETARTGRPLLALRPKSPAAQVIARMAIKIARGFNLPAPAR